MARFPLLLLVAAFLALGGPASGAAAAEAASAEAAGGEQARAALRKAVEFHRKAEDLSMIFKAETYNAALDKRDRYQGKLFLKDSSKFRLEIPGGTYVSDGETFWEYHPQNKQVLVRSARDMERNRTPGAVLLRFLDAEPLSAGSAGAKGREYLELRLDPSKALDNLDSLSILLDRKDHSVRRIASRDVSGNLSGYDLVSVKRNQGLKDSRFRFDPPKGVEVVDMR